VPALEAEGALRLDDALRGQLLAVSAATIDRRLAEARRRARPRGLPTTKPGSLLRRQIPVRTYTQHPLRGYPDEQAPGFTEIDLVAHCGESAEGAYCCTLDVVDLATGWTECEPVANNTRRVPELAVYEALRAIRSRMPFPLLGIDSGNGSEFINGHLTRYCREEGITFTRGRPYHKDDPHPLLGYPASSRRTTRRSGSSWATGGTRGRRRASGCGASTRSRGYISTAGRR